MTEAEFLQILEQAPQTQPVSFRLYHDTDGNPIVYSMEPLPGDYIEVDPATYALSPFNVRVVDGALCYIQPRTVIRKLQPHTPDGTPCHENDVCVVVQDQPHTKWNMTEHEIS